MPCEDAYLRAAASKRPSVRSKPGETLSLQVDRALTDLMEAELTFHLHIENLKRDLESCPDFNNKTVFKAIDYAKLNYIN